MTAREPRVLALVCDPQGMIAQTLRDDFHLADAAVGRLFPRLVDADSRVKALNFLDAIRADAAAYDWTLNVSVKRAPLTLHFSGGRVGEQLLVVGAAEDRMARKIFQELLRVNNEQANLLRAALKENQRAAAQDNSFDDVSRLNNELISMQRELAKQKTELEGLYQQAREASVKDTLTGVYNRRGFIALCQNEVQRANRFDRPLAMVMFDLDHFKSFNDRYGHAVGDLVLQKTAGRCSQALRKADILCRYGGEEFAVMLPETDLGAAIQVAERLRQAVSAPIETEQAKLSVTISLGVSVRNEEESNLEELLRRADQSLYRAKALGRNRVHTETEVPDTAPPEGKSRSAPAGLAPNLFDEISRLNNELISIQRELAKKNAELEQLNQLKNQFLGMAAHDLRSPLVAVQSYSELLLDEQAPLEAPERVEFLGNIHRLSRFMTALIDDLLSISAIEAGQLNLEFQPVDLPQLVRADVARNRLLAAKRQVEIALEAEELPPLALDPAKIEQVLDNLIGNAVKFSPRGAEVRVNLRRDEAGVTLSVRDRGPGIAAADMEKLFKPFGRARNKSAEGERSTGLGLAIVKRIVEGHRGKIWLESQVGAGSTFFAWLPFELKRENQ